MWIGKPGGWCRCVQCSEFRSEDVAVRVQGLSFRSASFGSHLSGLWAAALKIPNPKKNSLISLNGSIPRIISLFSTDNISKDRQRLQGQEETPTPKT